MIRPRAALRALVAIAGGALVTPGVLVGVWWLSRRRRRLAAAHAG